MPELGQLKPAVISATPPPVYRAPTFNIPPPLPISTAALSKASTVASVSDALKDLPQQFLKAYDEGRARIQQRKDDQFADQRRQILSTRLASGNTEGMAIAHDGVSYKPMSDEERARIQAQTQYYKSKANPTSDSDGWDAGNAGLGILDGTELQNLTKAIGDSAPAIQQQTGGKPPYTPVEPPLPTDPEDWSNGLPNLPQSPGAPAPNERLPNVEISDPFLRGPRAMMEVPKETQLFEPDGINQGVDPNSMIATNEEHPLFEGDQVGAAGDPGVSGDPGTTGKAMGFSGMKLTPDKNARVLFSNGQPVAILPRGSDTWIKFSSSSAPANAVAQTFASPKEAMKYADENNLEAVKMTPMQGGGVSVDGWKQRSGETQAQIAKFNAGKVSAQTIIEALRDYKSSLDTADFGDKAKSLLGLTTDLNTKFNSAALLVKDAALFNLGVLNGPDLEIIRRTLPDPNTFEGSASDKKDALKAIDTVINMVERKLKLAESLRPGGGASNPSTQQPSGTQQPNGAAQPPDEAAQRAARRQSDLALLKSKYESGAADGDPAMKAKMESLLDAGGVTYIKRP